MPPSKKASVKKGSVRKPAKKSGRKPSAKKTGKKRTGKKAATSEPKAKRVKAEGKPAGALMADIHKKWDNLSTSERKAVLHCTEAFSDKSVTSKRLNGFLNKQEQKKGTGKKSKKSSKKRAPSAFFAFLKEVRAEIKESDPDTSVTDIAKVAGALWKKMNVEQKAAMKIDGVKFNEEMKQLSKNKAVKRKRELAEPVD